MTRRTATFNSLSLRMNRDDKPFVLDNVNGQDVLDVFATFANGVSSNHLSIPDRKWWCEVAAVQRLGRACLVTLQSGSYGDSQDVVDTKTGSPAGQVKPDQSALVRTRVLCVIPPGQDVGVLAIERQGHESGGVRLRSLFHGHLVGIGPVTDEIGRERNLVAELPSITSGEAWLETASLRKVEAIRLSTPIDLRDGTGASSTVIQLREIFEPMKGESSLPVRIMNRIRGKDVVDAADYLHLDDPDDVDQIFITASDGDRQKRFALDAERSPAMRLVVKNHGDPTPDDRNFIELVSTEISPYFSTTKGIQWDPKWVR